VVGIVVVSHSAKLAQGLAELLAQMQPDVAVHAVGGAPDGGLGTSTDAIHEALLDLDGPAGTLVFLDLGSAAMSVEMALEQLTPEQRGRVLVSDAPLVEGAVLAAVSAGLGLPLAEVAASAQEAHHFPKDVLRPAAG
jgi:PTS hybrid protein